METTIKTFEDACTKLGISSEIKMDVSALPADEQKYFLANYKLMIIARALNDGWKPNWDDFNERKYVPWFDMDKETNSSGFGFSSSRHVTWYTATYVGSRLCFKSEEICDYIATQFLDLYNDLMTIEN